MPRKTASIDGVEACLRELEVLWVRFRRRKEEGMLGLLRCHCNQPGRPRRQDSGQMSVWGRRRGTGRHARTAETEGARVHRDRLRMDDFRWLNRSSSSLGLRASGRRARSVRSLGRGLRVLASKYALVVRDRVSSGWSSSGGEGRGGRILAPRALLMKTLPTGKTTCGRCGPTSFGKGGGPRERRRVS